MAVVAWILFAYIVAAGVYEGWKKPTELTLGQTIEKQATPQSQASKETQAPKETQASAENLNKGGSFINTCSTEIVFCSQQYSPATCELQINDKTHSAGGSNPCEASFSLKRNLCAAGVAQIPLDVWNLRACKNSD